MLACNFIHSMFFSIRSVDIIHGKLDQRNKQLEVDYTIGRDIKPDDIKKIAATLTEWCDSCESVLSTFESQIDRANAAKGAFIAHNEYIEQAVMHLLHWTTWLWQLNITQYLFTSCFFFFCCSRCRNWEWQRRRTAFFPLIPTKKWPWILRIPIRLHPAIHR